MKRNHRSVIASAATLAITGGVLAVAVLPAAASYPGTPWQPASATPGSGQADTAHQIGTLALFDSTGKQITGGTNLNHLFDYALASSSDPGSGSIANLEFANPAPATPPDAWANATDESSTTPNTSSSTPANLRNSSTPLFTGDSAGANLAAVRGGFPANTASGYQNVYEVRVFTTDAAKYWAADVLVTGTGSSATWSVVYGSPVTTITTLTASPNPQGQGGNVTLTATVTPADATAPVGSVTFKDGSTTLNTTSTFNSSGQATFTTNALTQGTHSLSAVFAPSSPGSVTYSGSTGTASETISAPATNTTTTLTISGNTTVGTDSTLSGTVSPSAAAGTVSFYDNGSSTPINSSPVAVNSGNYTYTLTGGFAAGSHSVVAKFTPTNPSAYNASQSQPVPFVTNQPSGTPCTQQPQTGCTDTQTITGTIPPGTLSISTPYTAAAPLNIGQLALSGDGTYWTGLATFKCITITDATSGGSPFVASALANPLALVPGTSVGSQNQSSAYTSINGQNVGLTSFRLSPATSSYCPDGTTPVNSYTKTVTPTAQPAALGVTPSDPGSAGLGGTAPHTLLTGTSGGEGTYTTDATITLNAPTSTKDGQYSGTVVFTVTD